VQAIKLPSCSIECWLLSDGRGGFRPEVVFDDLEAPELSALAASGAWGRDVPYNCLLVRAPDALVLVDTGLGAAQHPFGGSGGGLWQELAQVGVDAGDVDVVVVSHGHLDHIGGLTLRGEPAFTGARYVMAEDEWRYWTSSSVLDGLSELVATSAREQLPPLAAAGVLERIVDEVEVADSVRLVPAPGHTPAHLAVEVGNHGGMVFAVDAFLHPLQVERPERGRGMDHDPDTAVATRHALLARAAERNHLIAASHWDVVVQP
jgi:glyoxylase-like metal-dependent hydrolase (beta-lactamase superfamily II)